MTYICGFCGKHLKPPRIYPTWDDLIDHLINVHQLRIVAGKLMHYNTATKREADGRL